MKLKFILIVMCVVLFYENSAHAGAAVAMQGQKGAAQAQRKQMLEQLPPGYVMTPEGIRKLPEPGSPGGGSAQIDPSEVKDLVDPDDIYASLETSSHVWDLIISAEDKAMIVQEYIDWYADQNVVIKRPAVHYVRFIDEMTKDSKDMLAMPFERVIQIAAIMEYDFGNNQNPDLMAQKFLGPKLYEMNKKRLMAQMQQ